MIKKSDSIKQRLDQIFNMEQLPSEDILMERLDEAITVLESEDFSYRPMADSGLPGGLLDFKSNTLPVIVVPDLHARPEFLYKLMDLDVDGKAVFERLCAKECIVICVGDGIHSETLTDGYERWKLCYREWLEGNPSGENMKKEMLESVRTMMAVLELKIAFKENFHFLKGNHENIMNNEGDGDHAFHKYVMEGEQVRDFIQDYYSEGTLHLIRCFEHALPVCAIFGKFGVSHAEPERSYKRNEIINAREKEDLILGLTWTGNDEAWRNSVPDIYNELNPENKYEGKGVIWFGGHRPVEGKYNLRQNGAFVQIHNPNQYNVAVIRNEREFNPETDVVPVLLK